MAARLVFLGRLEDAAGMPEMAIEPGALEQVLARLDPALAVELLGERVRLALNGALLPETGGVILADGDELAFLPPVSGG
ncbi:MoaD/ThiS family protein [Novosphingobium cyanobacteriorum]|uniref:MoaD/ThiS family protein n=1 Tax=Novosphingobium cyanobacteriorum TaxID=3024215 RepID=A0ABT6CJL4_9SPHN|nr:MoaD/ThiS family protein [Novosphingobium cyanobacteriorum]MDF8332537.1 MoaD/ThiS family protein [Novosphingobium cyanobacteriorum]